MSFLIKRTVNDSLIIVDALSRTCQELGGPLTNQLYSLVEQGRYQEVANFSFDYSWKFTIDDFVYARQIQGLVAKQDFLDFGVDKESVAFKKFLASEELCRQTNLRFDTPYSFDKDVSVVLHYASRKITRMLGQVPTIDSLDFSFGPGATTSTRSFEANPRVKLSNTLHCSSNLLPLVSRLLLQLPLLAEFHSSATSEKSWFPEIQLANGKLAFVPKTSKEDRSIVVEPVLNGLIQKAIGSLMKKRFKLQGLDLTDQTRNQNLARKGSIDGSLATVDLSSASDTVSRGIVWNLLPFEWASLLDACRSEAVTYKGETYVLEKFSSMGNAYTFELESVIFFALAHSVCYHLGLDTSEVNCYGDDIIIPTAAYALLDRVLSECGFVINKTKSYSSGTFRESCGADFISGFDIRPFYLKEKISEQTLFTMHNFFLRHCEIRMAKVVKSFVREDLALYGPDGYGDGHLIGDYVPRLNREQKRAGFCGGVFDTYTLRPNSFVKKLAGDYMFPCYSIYVRGNSDPYESASGDDGNTIRGNSGYSKVSIYTLDTRILAANSSPVSHEKIIYHGKRRPSQFVGTSYCRSERGEYSPVQW